MFYVYILYSKILKEFYIGFTGDLDIRLKEHNCGRNSDTRTGIPWIMVYSESFLTLEEAKEKEFKVKETGITIFLKDQGIKFM
jgi:putative endonuclease